MFMLYFSVHGQELQACDPAQSLNCRLCYNYDCTFVFLLYCVVEDTLDSILGGSDDEAEEDAVISQVLDEIGIEVTGKVSQYSK